MHAQLMRWLCVPLAGTVILLARGAIADVGERNPIEIVPRTLAVRHSPVEPFTIALVVRNVSTTKIFSVKSVIVEYPIELVSAGLLEKTVPSSQSVGADVSTPPLPSAEETTTDSVSRSNKVNISADLQPGDAVERMVTVALRRPQFNSGDMKWLFISGGDYTFRTVVYYTDESGVEFERPQVLRVSFDAPFSALILGALVGALLIGLLRTWMVLLQTYGAGRLTSSVCFRHVIAFIGLQLPVSLLIALLAIILAKISTDFRGVLRIELNDFWAGLLVGILAQSTTGPIAEALGRVVGGVEPIEVGKGTAATKQAQTLAITTTTLPDGAANTAYPSTTLQTTGGTPPLKWSVTPALPTGLTLGAATGTISGIPTAALPKTKFTFTVTDSATPAASSPADLTLEIK